jgi:hypothetical protein
MKRLMLGSIILGLELLVLAGCPGSLSAQQIAPPPGFQKVSTLVALPEYLPGLGTLYVEPKTLPAGPFLAYNKQGKLVSSIYMIPLKEMDAHKNFEDLGVAKGMVPQRVELYFNAGHPGVPEPHYHVILWYVGEDEEPK